jgi:hypothetical protein
MAKKFMTLEKPKESFPKKETVFNFILNEDGDWDDNDDDWDDEDNENILYLGKHPFGDLFKVWDGEDEDLFSLIVGKKGEEDYESI